MRAKVRQRRRRDFCRKLEGRYGKGRFIKDVEDKRRYSLELAKKCFAALHECGDSSGLVSMRRFHSGILRAPPVLSLHYAEFNESNIPLMIAYETS